jgi:uncharacterized protein (TIGR03118 family)
VYATHAANPARTERGLYQVTNLVSNVKGAAKFADPNLRNPWGLTHSPLGPWWVADNNGHVVTAYRGDGSPFSADTSLVVAIPSPLNPAGGGSPTGLIFNPTSTSHPSNFLIRASGKTDPAMFLFASEEGLISGWNPEVAFTRAIPVVNRSSAGAVYKGLAFGSNTRGDFIYATNFRAGVVEMFNTRFQLIRSFTDRSLAAQCRPGASCFAPFGIQNIGGRLFVTFALQDKDRHDDVPGAGNGFVEVFDTQGNLLYRFTPRGPLNSPWGLALAPANFGRFSNDLLVGNFGDGLINAYNPRSGLFVGQLRDLSGKPLRLPGLWGLAFGNDNGAGRSDELFFSAGPNQERDGLFGKITLARGPHS